LRDRHHQGTLLAVTGHDDFAVFAAFEDGFKAVETQLAFLALLAVAPETRRLKERADVFGVSNALVTCRRRQFAEIEFIEVELIGGQGRPSGGRQADREQNKGILHNSFITALILLSSWLMTKGIFRWLQSFNGKVSTDRRRSVSLGHEIRFDLAVGCLGAFGAANCFGPTQPKSSTLWPNGAPGEKGNIGEERDMTKSSDGLIAGKAVIHQCGFPHVQPTFALASEALGS
jgi:hypothetical protein